MIRAKASHMRNHLFMMINYPDYFVALGFKDVYYDQFKNQFNSQAIIDKIKTTQEKWKVKYPLMDFKTQNLKFDNLVNFDHSFTAELEHLNMEGKWTVDYIDLLILLND